MCQHLNLHLNERFKNVWNVSIRDLEYGTELSPEKAMLEKLLSERHTRSLVKSFLGHSLQYIRRQGRASGHCLIGFHSAHKVKNILKYFIEQTKISKNSQNAIF